MIASVGIGLPVGNPFSGISEREICVRGETYNIGLVRGEQRSSLWQLTFEVQTFNAGSYTQVDCSSCNQTMRVVTPGATVWGVNLERNFRIKIFKDSSSIQPMFLVNGGAGFIEGGAMRYVGTTGTNTFPYTREGEAKAMFGSSFVPSGGVGVGLMGDHGRNITYILTLVGVKYPIGVYSKAGVAYRWSKKK